MITKISELITELESIKSDHGDLLIAAYDLCLGDLSNIVILVRHESREEYVTLQSGRIEFTPYPTPGFKHP